MQTYRLHTPSRVLAVDVLDDRVVQAHPSLVSYVGGDWPTLRDYARKRGWVVDPVPPTSRVTWLEVDGREYELEWRHNTLVRIVLHEDGETRDLSWWETPEEVRNLL